MTWPAATKNAALDGLTITHASLHTAFPGTTGANEVTGGTPAYARKAVTFNASAGGIRAIGSAATFDVPACTVRWVGLWNGTAFVGAAPNGGAVPKNFVALPATDVVYAPGHGWLDGQKVVFFNGTPPAGITEGTIYEVLNADSDTFQITAVGGESALNMTTAASFGCVVSAITEDVYASQGTHALSTASLVFSD